MRRTRGQPRPPAPMRWSVSNHGLFVTAQWDASSIRVVFPEIVSAVGSSIEVLFDGGIRSGQDVLKRSRLARRAR